MDKTTSAVRRAIETAPGSLRRLADAAGVDHTALVRIRTGERGASSDVAKRVAAALEDWAGDCRDAARAIRQTMTRKGRR